MLSVFFIFFYYPYKFHLLSFSVISFLFLLIFFFCVVYKEIDLLVIFSHSSLLTYTCQKILSFPCCQNFGIYRQTCLCTLQTYKGLTALSEMCLWILSSMLGLPSFQTHSSEPHSNQLLQGCI